MKPTITTEEKFFLIPKCLSEAGSIQELWAQAKTEAILLEERNSDDVLVELGEKSEEAFDQAILRFFRNWLHEESGDELKRYMQFYLRKHPKLLPRDLISRLEALNKYIMYIPAGIQEEGPEGNWLTGARSFT